MSSLPEEGAARRKKRRKIGDHRPGASARTASWTAHPPVLTRSSRTPRTLCDKPATPRAFATVAAVSLEHGCTLFILLLLLLLLLASKNSLASLLSHLHLSSICTRVDLRANVLLNFI